MTLAWPRHRVYGVTLASDFPFANRLTPANGTVDLTFMRLIAVPEPECNWELAAGPEVRGTPLYRLARLGKKKVVLRIADAAEHHLYPDRIVSHLLEPSWDWLVEMHLLGDVLALWLESRGIPALHASAVVVDGRAIVFVSGNKGGKSSLAATFMEAGFPLLTDDILPVEVAGDKILGRPGYPQLRLWPDQAAHFLGDHRDLPLVHPAYDKRRVPVGPNGLGSFHDQAVPIGALVLPAIGEGIEIESLSPRETLAAMVRESFTGPMIEALGWQRQRLPLLARIASTIPAMRLCYPRQMGRLPHVREHLLGALEDLGGRLSTASRSAGSARAACR